MTEEAKKPEAKKKAQKADAAKKEPAKRAAPAPAARAPESKAAAPKPAPKAKQAPEKTVKVTQVRSPAGRFAYQRATLRGLGLDRINRSSVLEDTPAVRGMIERVRHLVRIDPVA